MIIFGGVRIVISQGDAGKVKQARMMIVYALIGLVVAILAGVIVSFALDSV
jgi:hypothetical protein